MDLICEALGDVVRITPKSAAGAAFLVEVGTMESGVPIVVDRHEARRLIMRAKARGMTVNGDCTD